jgi:hypothetical protein
MSKLILKGSDGGINPWDYWVFGLSPSPGIVKNTNEHSVSESGSVFIPK